MPIIQASHPVFAPIALECKSNELIYLPGIKVGNMLSVSTAENFIIAPNFAGGKAHIKDAAIALNTSSIPISAYELMFGEIINGNEIIDPPAVGVWGGFGYIEGAINMNCDYEVTVTWINRVIFTPPPIAGVSRYNGSVTLTTPSISGRAYLDGTGKWRKRAVFGNPKEAISYLKSKAGIVK